MAFYDLHKNERAQLVADIHAALLGDVQKGGLEHFEKYFSDEDTYIRKAAYQALGKIYHAEEKLRSKILRLLGKLYLAENEKVRQTVINAAGEIGMREFEVIEGFMDKGLFDTHHSVRNAVIGSMKKMGEKNPRPVLTFAQKYLHHEDKEIRREICHGIELRGRTHPQDILPLLRELQDDKTRRVRDTLVHVLGQIAYKEGCLETVISDLRGWHNKDLVADAVEEIIDVHDRYKDFAVKTQEEARVYIDKNL
ncbi:MAG: HEAT repeat domain-containing protein [Bacteroidetes bacterium]|nr:HEAT repeat domain-containing protein [Bacteroidota bacterium]